MVFKSLALAPLAALLTASQPLSQGCPSPGLIESVGTGTLGSLGVPVLGTAGSPLEGKTLWFELEQGLPGAPGLLFGSLVQATLPVPSFGATLYLAPPLFTQVFALDGAGSSAPLFTLPTVPALCGIEVVAQAIVIDPVAMGGVAFSQAQRVRFTGPESGPLFAQPGGLLAGASPGRVVVEDLDGDGWLDLVVSDSYNDVVSVQMGSGQGSFGKPEHFPAGDGPIALEVADLDLDGALDLAVGNGTSEDISILLGDGQGGFVAAPPVPMGDSLSAIVVADLDGDGVPDLASSNISNQGPGGWVALGLGGGAFQASVPLPLNYAQDIAAGDIDGDGDVDLAMTYAATAQVWILLGNGDGSFGAPQGIAFGTFGFDEPRRLELEDFTGDGVLDLAVAVENIFPGTGQLLIARGLGNGSFVSHSFIQLAAPVPDFIVGNVDGDGMLDVVIPRQWSSISYDVLVLLDVGIPGFSPEVPTITGTSAFKLAIGDLDGDSDADLAVVSYSSGKVVLASGDGTGTFAWNPPVPLPSASQPQTVIAADLDGDGQQDLAVANWSFGEVAILKGAGNGIVSLASSVSMPGDPRAATVGDFDADGVLDLAAACQGTNVAAIRLGLAGGTFGPAQSYSVGEFPEFLSPADLDGDGALDLVVANKNSGSVSILMGRGDGAFDPAVSYSIGGKPSHLAIGDLNADGVLDLAVAHVLGNDRIDVLHGLGDGTFTTGQVLPLSGAGPFVAIEDVDGDDIPDLVAPVQGGAPAIAWFPGLGASGVGTAQLHALGAVPGALVVGDFDGDAVTDIVTLRAVSGDVLLLRGTGGGTFIEDATFKVPSNPNFIALADLDGNGAEDLVVLGPFWYEMKVLMSDLFH